MIDLSRLRLRSIVAIVIGTFGVLASVALLVFTMSHRPPAGFGETVVAFASNPNAWYLKPTFYLGFLFVGWGGLILSGLIVVAAIFHTLRHDVVLR